MEDNDLKKLKDLANSFKSLNTQVILHGLLAKANDEYSRYDYLNSRKTLEQALIVNPNSSAALRGMGCLEQFEKNDYDKAIDYFFKAIKYSEHKEIEYTLIGMAYYLKEDLDNSLKYFNYAIEQNENYDSAYEGRNQAMLEHHLKIIDLQEALSKMIR